MGPRESSQGRKTAALSGSSLVPQTTWPLRSAARPATSCRCACVRACAVRDALAFRRTKPNQGKARKVSPP